MNRAARRHGGTGQEKPGFWTPEFLAETLGLPLRSIYAWRSKGVGPPAYRFGKHLRYRETDVMDWIESRSDEARGSDAP